MSTIATVGVLTFFLIGTFVLTATSSAFRRIRRRRSKEELRQLGDRLFYAKIHRSIFASSRIEEVLFAIFCSQNITRFCSGIATVFLFAKLGLFHADASLLEADLTDFFLLILAVGLSLLLGDYIPRTWSRKASRRAIQLTAPIASTYLVFTLPLTAPFVYLSRRSWKKRKNLENEGDVTRVREKIIELIEEASAENHLEASDKKLIESALTFRDRVVREVMVPRVDLFALSAQTPLRDAAKVMAEKGFSRVPVYQGTMDQIIGILMYKDVLAAYMECEASEEASAILDSTVERFAKHVLYTPETKKVSDLLQEFRSKQMHIAIVVDEYGGTEGVVTIEDLLEEIVGDIADEYDEKEDFYTVESNGGWIVDARMSILDLEEQLGLRIPQDGEYDTVGGYVFHKAGTIPSVGLVIHHDDFELEILRSSDRRVERVRITPVSATTNEPVEEAKPVNE